MKTRTRRRGFEYFLTREQIRSYMQKPLELRLEWLYQGNMLRKHLPEHIRKRQDRFRQ